MTPAPDAERTRCGKVGKTEAQELLCTLMWFYPFLGCSTVAGTAKEAHTWHRRFQNLLALLPKVLSPACSLCLLVVFGENGRTTRSKYNLLFPEIAQHCCRDQQAHAGHAPLCENTSGTHRETVTLWGEETSV